jgi:hypothetical protein
VSKKNQAALREVLERSNSTSEFLEDVKAVVEALYAEGIRDECPEGFASLEEAIEAFEEEGD